MKPADAIASLDRQLAENGEDIVLGRPSSSSGDPTVTCRASVRGVRPSQVVGTIKQSDLNVIISPTQILAGQWPASAVPVAGQVDPRHPRITDYAIIKGKKRQVLFSDPIMVGGVWVRCNMLVQG